MNILQTFRSYLKFACGSVLVIFGSADAAYAASEARNIALSASFTADLAAVVDGGAARGARYLDNLDVTADLDLDALSGWSGAKGHIYMLNNLGGRPNDLAGTAQGINNIEVTSHRAKIYEAWIDQNFMADHSSLRLGLYDLNSEFCTNEAAGLLIAPAFGIGSELSATGPNGPSIFPSTALAARLKVTFGNTYAMAAALNANAATIGDPGGMKFSFYNGVLAIAEVGRASARNKIAVGAWSYSKRQPKIDADLLPMPGMKHGSRGVYMLAEAELLANGDNDRAVTGFARAGLSDGRTSPFKGGWQAGLLIDRPFAGRPESQLSIGVNQAFLSSGFRRLVQPGAPRLGGSETGFEISYSDRILPALTLQPDLQYIYKPDGDHSHRDVLVVGLRTTIAFDFGW